MKYRHQILVSFGFIILIFLGLVLSQLFFLNSSARSIQAISGEKYSTAAGYEKCLKIVLTIKADIWDTLLLQPENREIPLQILDSQARLFYKTIRQLQERNPAQAAKLEEIFKNFQNYYIFGSSVVRLKNLGDVQDKKEVLAKFQENQNTLTVAIEESARTASENYATSLSSFSISYRHTLVLTILLSIVVVAVVLALAYLLTARLNKPISKLIQAAGQAARGHYETRVYLNTRNELQVLGDIFNQMMAQIQDYQSHMQDIVARRTKELEDTLEELKLTQNSLIQSEKNASLAQLIASLAHELNTPLGAIRSSADFINRELARVLPELPGLFGCEDPVRLTLYRLMLKFSTAEITFYNSQTLRARKKTLTEVLTENGVEEPQHLAEQLADSGWEQLTPYEIACLKTPEARQYLEKILRLNRLIQSNMVIREAAHKSAQVIQALKTYLMETPATALSKVDLRQQIEDVLLKFFSAISPGVDIIWQTDETCVLYGYPEQLKLIWNNIIQNALQAMNYQGTLKIALNAGADTVTVSFADSGPGIPAENQTRIFTPFFTTKPPGEGRGLGLDIARKIAELHHGTISFTSRPGETVFSVKLRIAGKEAYRAG